MKSITKIFGERYAQFVKADAEYRYNWYINRANSLRGTSFRGVWLPVWKHEGIAF